MIYLSMDNLNKPIVKKSTLENIFDNCKIFLIWNNYLHDDDGELYWEKRDQIIEFFSIVSFLFYWGYMIGHYIICSNFSAFKIWE